MGLAMGRLKRPFSSQLRAMMRPKGKLGNYSEEQEILAKAREALRHSKALLGRYRLRGIFHGAIPWIAPLPASDASLPSKI
jgi:hypothetical protein